MKTFRKLSAHFKYDEVVDLNTATSAVQMAGADLGGGSTGVLRAALFRMSPHF